MQSVKVSPRFAKSMKEHRNKKGLEKVLRQKLLELDKYFDLSFQTIHANDIWVIKKLDATSMFGAYRIIAARSSDGKRIVFDFYFKNSKSDLDSQEIDDLKALLKRCEDDECYQELDEFDCN